MQSKSVRFTLIFRKTSIMKYFLVSMFLMCGLIACNDSDTPEDPTPPPPPPVVEEPDFTNLFWSQEFDTDIDPNVWTHEFGASGWGNNEWQNYGDSPENSFVEDGKLIIRANYNGNGLTLNNFTSARMITKDKFEFKYGKVEARVKLPEGQGIWPAFWMLGASFPNINWPDCGEIDIMEYLGHDTDKAYGTVHGPGYSGAEGVGGNYTLSGDTFNSGFHNFTIEWKENNIKWFIDDVQFHPDSSTTFPQQMEIDYIRVYR